MSCEIVDRSRVIDAHGKWSSVISTLPVITDGSLKGTVVHYKVMKSKVPISKGSFNMINLNVHANNESKFVGSVLLDLYIMYINYMYINYMFIWITT